MFCDDEWVPISALAHYSFCPRRVSLIYIENLWQDNQWTVEGRILHETTDQETKKTSRGIRYIRSLRIYTPEDGLYGVADVVEFTRTDGEFSHQAKNFSFEGIPLPNTPGRWVPVPIEFKRGKTRTDESYEVQLCAQALCLEYKFNLEIPFGYLYFGESGQRKIIPLTSTLRLLTRQITEATRKILMSEKNPEPKWSSKCKECSLESLCIPKMSKSLSVEDYIRRSIF